MYMYVHGKVKHHSFQDACTTIYVHVRSYMYMCEHVHVHVYTVHVHVHTECMATTVNSSKANKESK